MSRRAFSIPTFVVLGLVLNGGCEKDTSDTSDAPGASIVGRWELVEVNGEDADYTMNGSDSYLWPGHDYDYDYYDYDCVSSWEVDWTLEFETSGDDAYDGDMTVDDYTYHDHCPMESGGDSDQATFDAGVTKLDGRTFEIAIGDIDLDLHCVIEEDALDCEDGQDTYLFERTGG